MTSKPAFNDTALLFTQINRIGFYCGLPNFWINEPNVPKSVFLFLIVFRKITNVVIAALIVSEYVAILTQDKLTEKQNTDLVMFCFSHVMFYSYIVVMERHNKRIKDLLLEMVINLKVMYNDKSVEREMIMKSKLYSTALCCVLMSAVFMYGLDSLVQVVSGEGTFTTLITFWPDVENKLPVANYARIVVFLLWLMYMIRLCAIYVLVIPMTICLSHQFKNLQSYFYSLRQIFDEDISQMEKENKYEEAFKAGIRMHSQTIWCTKECQVTCGIIYSAQILTNIAVLAMIMSQMMIEDRTLVKVFPMVGTSGTMLISTGCFMWNAGDVTVEASALPTAMYLSGWHRCRASARRLRILLAITMTLGQKPVVLWALALLPLSYESYIKIVKLSYSIFSVLF